jgi:SNF2 family DNA or RNA helicase
VSVVKPIPYKNHLILPADARLRTLIPHAKSFMQDGQEVMLVPHQLDETTILKNLGYQVSPPVMLAYNWPGPPPFDAQRITTALITTHNRCYVLNGIGTGKTRSLLFAYDYLRQVGRINKLLVTAPLSTLRQTWEREVAMVFPHLKCSVLYGDKKKRLKALAEPADVYVINHDGLEVIFKELMQRTDIDMLGLDELSVYKNKRTDLWKYANLFGKQCKRVVGLTATPMPAAPTDAFGQLQMITPKSCDMTFTAFRDMTMIKVSEHTYVKRRDAVDRVHQKMQPAVRFTRDECYDLPPCQTVTREVKLSTQQADLYARMAGECAAAVGAGEVKAVNEADRINKLVQIALGTVYDMDRNSIELDCAPRLKELDALIEQSNSKVIVFSPYRNSLTKLAAHVRKRWTCEEINGDVGNTQRESIFTRFMHAADPHVIVAHPKTMSHGLTLTAASTIIWYGPPTSLEVYEQANGRITRAGQRHAQLIAHIAATKLEQKIFRRLELHAETQGLLLEMFENQELGDLL